VSSAERIAAGSVAVGAVVLGLKALAWFLTGSAALYSDAAESVVNVVGSGVAFLALRFAAMPADANHPYGHDKAELFAAIIAGVLIVLAALAIMQHAWGAYISPAPLTAGWQGASFNAVATLINFFWASFMLRRGTALRSPALLADAKHVMGDVVTSLGVVGGFGLALTTGLLWMDPLLAALTACYILWSGSMVIRESVGGLMDAAPSEHIVLRIRELVGQHAEGAIEAHDLRTRHAGRLTFLEFHLVVPADMTVSAAHEICDRIEEALKSDMEGLMITIHVEPEAKAKHHGVLVL
jgi:cation diffusion facilitator family transporter